MWQSDRNQIVCIANRSTGVAYNADQELNGVYLKHRYQSANGLFSGRIWSPTEQYLIGFYRHFAKYWLAICSQ